MATYYYSTQPFLAWCLNHYFYGGVHFAWVGAPFYPYKLSNPRTSSPFRIYEDLYEPWKDQDEFSGYLANLRLRLRNGVIANAATLADDVEPQLLDVCDRINLVFFYPIVYRVDTDTIAASRLRVSGSGSIGSNEYRIDALTEDEFDILLIDFASENVPQHLKDLWGGSLPQDDVLTIFSHWLV